MNYIKKVLPNGLRIILVPMKDNPTVTVSVSVEAGSKYEVKKISGISHFLEHMCFKGTIKRPTALQIASELDALGSSYNALTSQEFTSYYAKVRAVQLPCILDVISDIYLNPTFQKEELEKERGVIIEEINMYEDMPQQHVQDLFSELLYGDQPAGWNVAGTKETVSNMTPKELADYREKHYVSAATVITIAGDIDADKTLQMVEDHFAQICSAEKPPKIKVIEKQDAPAIKILNKQTDQVHLVLGVRSYSLFDKKARVAELLGSILGGGMSSRLFEQLRNKMGIGYYVHAAHDASTDHGVFAVSTGVDRKRVKEAIDAILQLMRELRDITIPEEELARVKEHLIGHLYLGLESSNSLANFYGFQEILGKPIQKPEEIIAEWKKITADDLKAVAKEIFQDKNLNLALIGPFEDEKTFLKDLHF